LTSGRLKGIDCHALYSTADVNYDAELGNRAQFGIFSEVGGLFNNRRSCNYQPSGLVARSYLLVQNHNGALKPNVDRKTLVERIAKIEEDHEMMDRGFKSSDQSCLRATPPGDKISALLLTDATRSNMTVALPSRGTDALPQRSYFKSPARGVHECISRQMWLASFGIEV
jgi:hypothetical protein